MRQNTINCTHHFPTIQVFFTCSNDNLSCGEFLYMTICHVKKISTHDKNSPKIQPVLPVLQMSDMACSLLGRRF